MADIRHLIVGIWLEQAALAASVTLVNHHKLSGVVLVPSNCYESVVPLKTFP